MSSTEGKVILITGASSGFGHTLALKAVQAGYKVIATVRKTTGLDDLVAAGITLLELDSVSPESKFVEFAKSAADVYGRIDVVVLNAGTTSFGTIQESSISEWEEAFNVNFWGAFKLVQALLPLLIAQGNPTSFIFNSTQTHELGIPLVGAYNTSKAALTALADTLKQEIAEYNMQVMTLQAGSIRTPFTSKIAPPQTSVKSLQPIAGYIAGSVGTEPLDPAKGAKRVLDILASGKLLPERLLFGQQAYGMTTAKWQQRLEDAKANEALSIGIDIGDP